MGLYLDYIRVILGFSWDNRTSNGNYYLACLLELFGSEFMALSALLATPEALGS